VARKIYLHNISETGQVSQDIISPLDTVCTFENLYSPQMVELRNNN